MGRREKEYAVYKGEEFIDIGTAKELAERFNTTVKTIQWYAGSKRYKNQTHKKGGYTIVAIEEDEEDELE